MANEHVVRLRRPHPKQAEVIDSLAPRKVVRAGRRAGKTTCAAICAVLAFLAGKRVLYAVPTTEQLDRFWFEVKRALTEPLEAGLFYKNESRHVVELAGTEQRIRGKTAWDADSLRGDYADLLVLDEWQLVDEEAWERVGAPMLLDNGGDALFIYTPPSLRSRSRSKARDPRHAAKMFEAAERDGGGRWAAFHFTSLDNPHISKAALDDVAADMTRLAYEQEILALDKEESPDALWRRREMIEVHRVTGHPDLVRVVVGVDPSGGAAECGIVVAGKGEDGHGYVLEDRSLAASPDAWAKAVAAAYHRNRADRVVAEANFGGDMVESVIRTVDPAVAYKAVTASRGKAVRAEPVAALYEQGRIHHVGTFAQLEDEMCQWVPGAGMPSPNRLDALVWALTELALGGGQTFDEFLKSLDEERESEAAKGREFFG